MSDTDIKVYTASVKVMRSHDYCHFEVQLSMVDANPSDGAGIPTKSVDDLRKTAARLADKAVEQYKIAKENADLAIQDDRTLTRLRYDAREISEKPESERTPAEKAKLKAIQDLNFKRGRYDYEDDWQEEDEWQPVIPKDEGDTIF